MYKQLQLNTEQMKLLARRWHTWKQRRVELSQRLSCSFATIQSVLPSCGARITALQGFVACLV